MAAVSVISDTMRRRVTIMVDKERGNEGAVIQRVARVRLDDLIRSGRFPSTYRRFVDGREAAPEESVKLNGGEILYLFSGIAAAVAYAIAFIKGISPIGTGRFLDSWFLIVDGTSWTGSIASIPSGAVVLLTNAAPYTRRLEQGRHKKGRKGHVPGRFMTEAARQAVQKKYPNLLVERTFVNLASGPGRFGWQVPYILRTGPNKGSVISYPAVRISER